MGDAIELVEFKLALRPYEPGHTPAVAERVQIGVQAQPGLVVWMKSSGKLIKAALTSR